MDPIEKAWSEYAKLEFDAENQDQQNGLLEEPRARRKSRGRTKVTHSKEGIPLLPDIREMSLNETKTLVQEFITGYYSMDVSSFL